MVVPGALRATIGKAELIRSLRTKDAAAARRLAPAVVEEFQNVLAAARGESRALTLAEIDGLCGEWYRQQMARWGADPGTQNDWDAYTDLQTEKWHEGEYPTPGVQRQLSEPTGDDEDRADAHALLAAAGIRADAPSLGRLAARLVRTKLAFGEAMLSRLNGQRWTAEAPQFPPPPSPGGSAQRTTPNTVVSFASLLDGWARENGKAERARYDRERTLERLKDHLGHDDASRVTSADAIRFKEWRLDKVTIQTVRNDLSELSAIWQWAVRNQKVENNPFKGISPAKPKRSASGRQLPFDEAEARRLLEASRSAKGCLRWLPWLLCFTGARVGEIAQARKEDITRSEGDNWILHIHADGPSRTVKTDHSERLIPLHPALIAEGFADYVAALPAGAALWPDLKANTFDQMGDYASKKHGRWVRETVGISDRRKAPAHAWRHRFEDEARRAGIPKPVVDGVLGHHNPVNEGDGYGRGHRFMPDTAAPHIARMRDPTASGAGQ